MLRTAFLLSTCAALLACGAHEPRMAAESTSAVVAPSESGGDSAAGGAVSGLLAESTTSQAVTSDVVRTGPLLVYSASFTLSVFEVEASQAAVKALAKRLGGYMTAQSATSIVVRVPSAQFEAAVAELEHTGKVVRRDIAAEDVGDQYRDLTLRLRTAEVMRARLEQLLAHANVKEALEVEAQLQRLVLEIEQIKGTLRSLHERLAYSLITVYFAEQAQPLLDQGAVFRLPFPWLEELGVHTLLEVRR